MNPPRKPIFGFLWPTASARGPLDADYVQVRMIRVPTRSAARLVLLALATMVIACVAAGAILAAAQTHWLLVIPVAIIVASCTVLLMRAWTIGTYVNDTGIAVQRLLRTVTARWHDVDSVIDADGVVIVRTRAGRVFDTTIATRSLDILGRAEAYDMAKLQLQRWGEQR